MVKKHYQTWVTLGGKINHATIIDDLQKEIESCVSYQTTPLPDQPSALQRGLLLLIASDQADLITQIVKIKAELDNGNVDNAQAMINRLFH